MRAGHGALGPRRRTVPADLGRFERLERGAQLPRGDAGRSVHRYQVRQQVLHVAGAGQRATREAMEQRRAQPGEPRGRVGHDAVGDEPEFFRGAAGAGCFGGGQLVAQQRAKGPDGIGRKAFGPARLRGDEARDAVEAHVDGGGQIGDVAGSDLRRSRNQGFEARAGIGDEAGDHQRRDRLAAGPGAVAQRGERNSVGVLLDAVPTVIEGGDVEQAEQVRHRCRRLAPCLRTQSFEGARAADQALGDWPKHHGSRLPPQLGGNTRRTGALVRKVPEREEPGSYVIAHGGRW
jgi:hypothetical protein